jgi:hypothetical protein
MTSQQKVRSLRSGSVTITAHRQTVSAPTHSSWYHSPQTNCFCSNTQLVVPMTTDKLFLLQHTARGTNDHRQTVSAPTHSSWYQLPQTNYFCSNTQLVVPQSTDKLFLLQHTARGTTDHTYKGVSKIFRSGATIYAEAVVARSTDGW